MLNIGIDSNDGGEGALGYIARKINSLASTKDTVNAVKTVAKTYDEVNEAQKRQIIEANTVHVEEKKVEKQPIHATTDGFFSGLEVGENLEEPNFIPGDRTAEGREEER